ncbi:hypothetical protein Kpol_448p14 [Vanderwaltozyma polyspora DSM 70294]|uniref:Potassium transport protein n=1 Tax=Vanderwaltozyma polyspora (strain ATCC 22028 / DSM 70294 / BCRC 21397 / CBS 2163 / NBRC 10782 / NRRL Y-8283 / UCD 57-17) TaxID=436907 RepID=A7TQY9_VANPO|nr:uncharacterized protein Kpol_448p14 [Vanderwaltozyma polyspora DSM 70294]EDO15326.1 hypothetical protein Kpol_448p14 [Vanderwaltozyma polyspora DSM 70294]
MKLRRIVSRVPTFSSINVKYKKSIGHRIRDSIDFVTTYFHPVKKYLFPNFVAVHYFYIISMTILASILLYPVKNHAYIDILFLAAGATTQGGLNTVDVNSLTLYQQLIIYIICCLSTPIIIHGFLAFVRLYWFERHFDGIRVTSKRDFKMRRTRTIIERQMTARTMSARTTSMGRFNTSDYMHRSSNRNNRNTQKTDFQAQLFSGKMVNRDEQNNIGHFDNLANETPNENSDIQLNRSSASINTAPEDEKYSGAHETSLMFKEPTRERRNGLKPERFVGRRKSTDITPADMYRSISILQDRHKVERQEDDSGPALVIKAPTYDDSDDQSSDNIESPSDRYSHAKDNNKPANGEIKLNKVNSPEPDGYSNTINHDNNRNRSTGFDSHPISTSSEEVSSLNSDDTIESHDSYDDSSSSGDNHSVNSEVNYDSRVENPDSSLDSEFEEESEGEIRNLSRRNTQGNIENNDHPHNNGPSIQFNLVSPPRKRRTTQSFETRPQPIKRSSSNFLKSFRKKNKFKEKLRQRRASVHDPQFLYDDSFPEHKANVNNSQHSNEDYYSENEDERRSLHDIPNLEKTPVNLKRATTNTSNRGEFNEMNPLERSKTFDVASPSDLDKLTQSPEFQKLVYKNWKENNKKRRGMRNIQWNNNIFENDRPELRHFKSVDTNDGNIYNNIHFGNPNHINEHNSRYISRQDTNLGQNYEASINNNDEEDIGNYHLHFDHDFNLAYPSHSLSRTMSTNYLSWQPTIGRNSTFVGLNRSQKNELGGVEYRAIKLLCLILLVYYVGFHVMAFIFFLPWVLHKHEYKVIVRGDGVSPTWWGFFTAMSAFNDLGLTLTPDSMSSFKGAVFPLTVMIWFIIIGNTGFPVLLRFIIWVLFKLSPDLSSMKESLGFLLDHPRRCFTLLFPSGATLWLLVTLIALNSTDLVLFVIFDFNSSVVEMLTKGRRVLVGLFQGVCTRTAGFSVIDLSLLHPSIQVSYMLMMYVSVLPLAISIRRTNVYEEQSLGIYGSEGNSPDVDGNDDENSDSDSDSDSDSASDSESESDPDLSPRSKRIRKKKRAKKKKAKKKRAKMKKKARKKPSAKSFIGAHLRRQLSFDLWFLFLGLFIICICEGGKIRDRTKPDFNVFSILFELVSAYGTVGLSLGYPGTNQSFSGQFTTISKLVIIAMLIRGRNRGLPYSVDRAIILPSERLDNMDHIQELENKRNADNDVSSGSDPVTLYLKKRIRRVFKGIRRVKDSIQTVEEPLVHKAAEQFSNSEGHEMQDMGNEQYKYTSKDYDHLSVHKKFGPDNSSVEQEEEELNESTPRNDMEYGEVDPSLLRRRSH